MCVHLCISRQQQLAHGPAAAAAAPAIKGEDLKRNKKAIGDVIPITIWLSTTNRRQVIFLGKNGWGGYSSYFPLKNDDVTMGIFEFPGKWETGDFSFFPFFFSWPIARTDYTRNGIFKPAAWRISGRDAKYLFSLPFLKTIYMWEAGTSANENDVMLNS